MNLLKPIIILFFILLVVHFAATFNYWYWKIWWLDIPMHFFGGILAAMIFTNFITAKISIEKNKKIILFLITLGLVSLVAVFWEFYEFFCDILFSGKYMQIDSTDTLKDIAFGLLGSAAFYLLYAKNKSR